MEEEYRSKFVSARVAAEILGVHPTTLANWVRAGKVSRPLKGERGRHLYPREELECLLNPKRDTMQKTAERTDPRINCNFYKSFDWRVLRSLTLARDHWLCQYCGWHAETADHVIPRRAGGKDTLDNLVAVCKGCNGVLSNYAFDSFDERLAFVLEAREGRREARRPRSCQVDAA